MPSINQDALDRLYNNARTYSAWLDKPVEEALLHQLYDLTKMAPTSMNCQPLRVVFVVSDEAKAKLKPCLAEGNVDKTMRAPVTAILAMDMNFYEELPRLFPHSKGARDAFANKPELIEATAFRNSSLQGGYFILAARALGLDCGPMSGFDNDAVDAAFFAGTGFRSNFLCNLGYGDESTLHPRSPRPEFDHFCRIA